MEEDDDPGIPHLERDLESKMWTEFQVQLGKEAGGIIRQSWMKTTGLWSPLHWEWRKSLENMAIVNALQLEAAWRRAVPICFNSSPVPSLNSLSPSVAVIEHFCCWYITLHCDLELWPRDLELWPLTLNMCGRSASPRSNSVQNLSEIEQSAAALLTLWPWTRITCSAMLWDSLPKV